MKRIFTACLLLGLLSTPVDAQVSAESQQKACESGNAESCTQLGNRYATGNGVEKNHKQMLMYFGKACDLKNQTTCKIYDLDDACARGNAEACYSLGTMYQEGYGVKLNRNQALEYFSKGCDLNARDSCMAYQALSDS